MEICPDCGSNVQNYFDLKSSFIEYVCWKCGFYASNSPAYRSNPKQFRDLIRNNPSILKRFINRKFTDKKTTADYTDTLTNNFIRYWYRNIR